MANFGTSLRGGALQWHFAVRDEAGIIANFRALDARLQKRVRASVHRAGTRFLDIVRATVAKDTGRMERLARVDYSDSGLIFEGGWRAEDFLREGQPFYPPYVEVGTYVMAPQPSIVPAWLEVQGQLRDDIAADFQRAGTDSVPAPRNRR